MSFAHITPKAQKQALLAVCKVFTELIQQKVLADLVEVKRNSTLSKLLHYWVE